MKCASGLKGRAGLASKPRVLVATPPQLAHRIGPAVCRGKYENFDHLIGRESDFGSPIVDWLLVTNKYADNLTEAAIAELRERELRFAQSEQDGYSLRERVRRLRIAMANKGRTPWNMGKKHKPGARVRKAASMHGSTVALACIEVLANRTAYTFETLCRLVGA